MEPGVRKDLWWFRKKTNGTKSGVRSLRYFRRQGLGTGNSGMRRQNPWSAQVHIRVFQHPLYRLLHNSRYASNRQVPHGPKKQRVQECISLGFFRNTWPGSLVADLKRIHSPGSYRWRFSEAGSGSSLSEIPVMGQPSSLPLSSEFQPARSDLVEKKWTIVSHSRNCNNTLIAEWSKLIRL